MNEIFVPNLKHCPRCNFRTDNKFIDFCLNCNTQKLWPVSWEKCAGEFQALTEKQFEAIKKQTDELRESRIAESYAIEQREQAFDKMEQARSYINDLYAKRGEDVLTAAICESVLKILER